MYKSKICDSNILNLRLQPAMPEPVVETPPPSTNDKHEQPDECRPSPSPVAPAEEAPPPAAQPSPPAPNEPKNGSAEETPIPSAPSDRDSSGAPPPPAPNNSNCATVDVRNDAPPRGPSAAPSADCAATPPAADATAPPSKNGEPPRYSEPAPATVVEDDRAFRKVSHYYASPVATVADRCERPGDASVDKYRSDRAREKPVVDANTKMYNQTNLGGANNAAAAFMPFNPAPAQLTALAAEKAVNLSESRPYGLAPVAQGYANYEMQFQRQYADYVPEEKYAKSKRLKSTSPTKSASREAPERYKSATVCEPQLRKAHAERDERYAVKETNLEQKVRKIAQLEDEQQQKYKERSRVKSPVVAQAKERKPTKSPSTYAMDVVNEYAVTKHMEEMKYKRRGDYEEHLMAPVGVANMELASQHFAGATHLAKQSLASPHERSMGVYTPDSTTNSVHSVHGYGSHQYDMEAAHLGIESPSSISSQDMNSQLSANEMVRPPSGTLSMHEMYMNQSQQAMFALQQQLQTHSMHTLPQLQAAAAAAAAAQSASSHVKAPNSRKNSNSANHHGHHHHRTKSTGASAHHQHSGASLNSGAPSAISPLHRSTPTGVGNPHSPVGAYNSGSPNGAAASSTSPMAGHHRATPPAVNHQAQSRHHQISYAPPHPSHHSVMASSGFLGVSQMTPVSYPVPVTTVIQQHRMTEPQQRLGSSPCATSASTFYMPPHMQSTAGACTTSGSASGCAGGRLQTAQVAGAGVNPCSLTKLQQLTNGLDMLPPGHCGGAMTPSSPINLTPPPPGSHSNMNTPPVAHQVLQQNYNKLLGNLGSAAQSSAACTTAPSAPSPSTPVVASPTSSSSSVSSQRSSRGVANHHHGAHHHAAANSRTAPMSSANVINPMMRYGGGPYGYQMAGQPGAGAQPLGYIGNGAAGFQPQIPVRMGVMNVAAQNQYGQDPAQNSMYGAYYGSYLR